MKLNLLHTQAKLTNRQTQLETQLMTIPIGQKASGKNGLGNKGTSEWEVIYNSKTTVWNPMQNPLGVMISCN